MNPPLSPSQQLHRLRNLSMAAELRQQFSYDSNCYLALSHLVPTLTDILYHDFLQKEIFKPLGMKDAHCDSNEVRASGRAVDGFLRKGRGNDQDSDDLAVIGKPMPVGWWTYDHGYWMLAAGGIAMTINDAVSRPSYSQCYTLPGVRSLFNLRPSPNLCESYSPLNISLPKSLMRGRTRSLYCPQFLLFDLSHP